MSITFKHKKICTTVQVFLKEYCQYERQVYTLFYLARKEVLRSVWPVQSKPLAGAKLETREMGGGGGRGRGEQNF